MKDNLVPQKKISIIKKSSLEAPVQCNDSGYDGLTGEGVFISYQALCKKLKQLPKEEHYAIYKIVSANIPKEAITTSGNRTYFSYTKLPQKVRNQISQFVEMTNRNIEREKIISAAEEQHRRVMDEGVAHH